VEGSVDAGSAGASAGLAILTPSADGFHGCQGGGGPTQATDFHITELLGSQHTQDTHTHGTAIDHTDDGCTGLL